jgi:hypothetical protein
MHGRKSFNTKDIEIAMAIEIKRFDKGERKIDG